MRRSAWHCVALLAVLTTACGDSALLPTESGKAVPQSGSAGLATTCTVDTAAVRLLLTQAFSASPDQNAVLGKWNNIIHQMTTVNDVPTAKEKTFALVDFMLKKNQQQPLTITQQDFVSLLNQLFCFVGIDAGITDPSNTWIVPVGNGLTTFVTADRKTGIQFPADAVPENTIVTVTPGVPSDLVTLLDKYPLVFNWKLSGALKPGALATVGVCPSTDPLLYSGLSDAEIQALLDRLVLGHQKTTGFEVLPRVPLPAEMTLACGTVGSTTASASWAGKAWQTLARLILPAEANAARRAPSAGGVGGSTSEFSPFAPVDADLFSAGGVGGSTSEFLRATPNDATLLSAPATIDGTIGTTKTGAGLPTVTIQTRRGTPIPGVTASFATAPSVKDPYAAAPGNATVCGNGAMTDAAGVVGVTCLNFGNTVAYRTAYTKLTATLGAPAGLDPSVIRFSPADPAWLIASSGPSTLVFTQPAAGSYSADAAIPARVEIRSDLGDVVTLANNAVTLSLNQFAFMGGATTMTANAVSGVATFSTRITKAATGYRFGAAATLSDVGVVGSVDGSNFFDVVAGAATNIAVVGTTDYGAVLPAGNPVSPAPKVRVTDGYGNLKSGTTVWWTPGGATGAQANGTVLQSSTTTAGDATTTATWLLAEGENLLRASLQQAAGGPEVFFTASFATAFSTINACLPGGAKDDIAAYYFTTAGPAGGNRPGVIHSVGLYLSAAGAVGQIDPLVGYPMTLVARRTVKTSSTNATPVTEQRSASALAFLRGDNGGAGSLVTFQFDLGPVPTDLLIGSKQPEVSFAFEVPSGGYGRKINMNAGPCALGKCNPPPGCDALEYAKPIVANNAIYRKSVALLVTGR